MKWDVAAPRTSPRLRVLELRTERGFRTLVCMDLELSGCAVGRGGVLHGAEPRSRFLAKISPLRRVFCVRSDFDPAGSVTESRLSAIWQAARLHWRNVPGVRILRSPGEVVAS